MPRPSLPGAPVGAVLPGSRRLQPRRPAGGVLRFAPRQPHLQPALLRAGAQQPVGPHDHGQYQQRPVKDHAVLRDGRHRRAPAPGQAGDEARAQHRAKQVAQAAQNNHAQNLMESRNPNEPGLMKRNQNAYRPPATPAKKAASTKAVTFMRVVSIPMADAATSSSRMAMKA